MKDLVTEGLHLALHPEARPPGATSAAAANQLAECFAEANRMMKSAPRAPIAREHLNKGRRRLDKAWAR